MAATHNGGIVKLLIILAIAVPIQSQEPTIDPITVVQCRETLDCEGNSVMSTIKDCCDHNIDPFGLAYTTPSVEGCQLCPLDFGFNLSSFSGIERGESHRVKVMFFSGGIDSGIILIIRLDLSGTASANDVTLSTTVIRFLPRVILEQIVEFSFTVDNVAQEYEETFAITLELAVGTLGQGANFRNRLEGVIIDSDVINFLLSEVDYTQNEEPDAKMEIFIAKESGIWLANPVYFRVTPMTVDDALARGVISQFDDENPFSPNRADYEDFDNTVIFFIFPVDEGLNHVELTIPIVDDDIDEADEQVFIILLEVIYATNVDKVNIFQGTSIGRIRDNEMIRIGFEFESYEVTEPNPDDENVISNLVYLIREDNQKSEQTYSVDLTVGDPGGNTRPATLETFDINESFDYSFGSLGQTRQNVLFPSTMDRIAFVFSLNPDLAKEGTETFRATSAQATPIGFFPLYQTPGGVTAFATTLIHILDNDELEVGFEELNYTVKESAGTVEVCVIVISPPPTAELSVSVTLTPSTIDGTAEAGSDFTQLRAFLSITVVFPSSPRSPTAGPRRECFDVAITDDDILENTESFSLLLQEDKFGQQTGATINPNQTEIFILDDDEVTVGFEHTTYLVDEGDVVEVCAVLTGTLEKSVEVFVNSSSGSATVAADYIPVFETLTFGPAINHTCFNVTTVEDQILEEDIEDVNLHLRTMAMGITFTLELAQVQICDDDRSHFACRNLKVLQESATANTITVRWKRPLITERDDYYDIFYSDPEQPGNFQKHNQNPFINNHSLVMYSVSGLRPLTNYTIRVVVQNGVRNQDLEGEEGRRCEVSVTTGDFRVQPPRSVTSFCSVIVWKAPTRAYGVITGYEVSFSLPSEDNGVIISKDRDEFFHAVRASELPRGEGDILVTVRAKTMSHNGTWSDAIFLNCTGIDGGSACPGF